MRCSVVFGVTLRLLVIKISSSSPAVNIYTTRDASEHVMERPTKIIRTALQETNTKEEEVTHQDIHNFRAARYRERRKRYGRIPKTLQETIATLRSMPFSIHMQKRGFLDAL